MTTRSNARQPRNASHVTDLYQVQCYYEFSCNTCQSQAAKPNEDMSKRQHERKDGRRAFQHSVLCMEGGQGVCGAVVMAISATKATKMDRMYDTCRITFNSTGIWFDLLGNSSVTNKVMLLGAPLQRGNQNLLQEFRRNLVKKASMIGIT